MKVPPQSTRGCHSQDVFLIPVSEIKLLFCALTGCTSHKTVHPEISPCTLPVYSNNKWLKKHAHTGCTPPKIVHPAVEMCTPGAGCALNFGHWILTTRPLCQNQNENMGRGGGEHWGRREWPWFSAAKIAQESTLCA